MSCRIFYGFMIAVTWGCNCSLPSSHWNPTTIQPSWSAQLRHIICCKIHWTHSMISQQVWANGLMFHEGSPFFSTSVHHRSSEYIDQELNKPLTERRPYWGLTRLWLSWSQRIPSDFCRLIASRIKESSRIKQIYCTDTAYQEPERYFSFLFHWERGKARFNVFITMNPGYASNSKISSPLRCHSQTRRFKAGRSELPDNLAALFRPMESRSKVQLYRFTTMFRMFRMFQIFWNVTISLWFSDLFSAFIDSLLLIYCIVHMWPAICNAACLCHDIMHMVTLPSCIKKQSNRCLFLGNDGARLWQQSQWVSSRRMFVFAKFVAETCAFDLRWLDQGLIGEISFYAFGFEKGRHLAKKMVLCWAFWIKITRS